MNDSKVYLNDEAFDFRTYDDLENVVDIFDLQSEFMDKSGQIINGFVDSQATLYSNLIQEELDEFYAENYHDHASAKEACDIIVVASGYLISLLGVEKAKRAYRLVHDSNMSKLQGKIEKREDGKVLKNDLYKKQVKEKLMSDLKNLIDK